MRGDNVAIPGLLHPREIGRGGFGVVYRAEESELGREVAVKVLTGNLDAQTRTRFERERRAMGVLSSHPNIITIFRSGTAETGQPYLVMEYLPGGSLADRLRSGALSWQDAVRIGVELAGALESAHRAGVLHRDVKPGNIMVDALGRAKLGDFGIARLDGGPETRSSVITASVAHAPPEVIGGDKPDERSDVYSLASTLYELTSGAPAFVRPGDESMIPLFARIVHEAAPDLRHRGVPDALAAVLEKAMSKARDDRYQSAAELGRALIDVQRRLGLATSQLWVAGAEPAPPVPNEVTRLVAPPAAAQGHPAAPAPPPPAAPHQSPQPAAPLGPSGPPPPAPPAPSGPAPIPGPGTSPVSPTQQPTTMPNSWPAPPATTPAPAAHGGTSFVPPPGLGQHVAGRPIHLAGHQPPKRSSRTGLIVVTSAAAIVVFGALLAFALRPDDGGAQTDEGQAFVGQGDDGSDADSDSGSSSDGDRSSDPASPTTDRGATVTTPTVTVPTVTLPIRPDLLVDLPSLPDTEAPYERYRTITDTEGAFILDVPEEWVDELPSEGQIIVSSDNNAALGDATISGGVISGTQGIGVFDADFFLDALLESLEEPDDPCSEVFRRPYDDGAFDGLLHAEWCNGGELLVVSVLVADSERASVILVAAQMTDERDVAAFQRMLDSFVLLDASLLPVAT